MEPEHAPCRLLFNDSWLFSAVQTTECTDIHAMIGQPESEAVELAAESWAHPVALGKRLAEALQVARPALVLTCRG